MTMNYQTSSGFIEQVDKLRIMDLKWVSSQGEWFSNGHGCS